MNNPVSTLRRLGLVEGISMALLVGVAMPLKYLASMPMAVSVVGAIHGLLFTLYCVSLAWTTARARWPLGRACLLLGAAILPFGPFLVDGRMRAHEAEFAARPAR